MVAAAIAGMGLIAWRWAGGDEPVGARASSTAKRGNLEPKGSGRSGHRAEMSAAEVRRAGEALFRYATPANATELTRALPAPSPEIHYVRLNRAMMEGKRSPFWQPGGRVEIPLPRGGTLAVAIDRSELTGIDQFTSAGRIEGRPLSRAVFGYCGGFLHASIEDPVLGTFVLRAATEEVAQFYRVDPAMVAGCGGPRPAAAAANVARPQEAFAGTAAAENPQRAVIHLMMVHTPAALPTLSGQARRDALQSAFLAAVEKVNVAFEASLVTARVKLVRVHETQFPADEIAGPKAGWQDEALTALHGDRDGAMDEIHALRDASGADVVCLALQRADFASSGLSFLLDEPGRFDNADYAFSVVQYGHIGGSNVVAHELGHVLGCAHERGPNAPNPAGKTYAGAFPYSYGYRFVGGDGRQYHDIMAYPPGTELSYFSNPRVVLPTPVSAPIGVEAGRPGEADTARTIEQTAFQVAAFRLQTQAAPNPGVLVNVATRAWVGQGEQVLIGGFVVEGARTKRLLVRAAGPALREFGVADALRDPVLRVFAGAAVAAENDNWSGAGVSEAVGQAGAFPFAAGSADAAVVVALAPGAYTAVVEGARGETGAALMEVFDLEAGATERVINLATRGFADNTGREMHGGFVLRGAPGEMKRVLVRVLGPSLARAPFRMSGVLDDPVLQLRNAAGELLVENDDWSSGAEGGANAENDFKPFVTTYSERQIFATGHAPGNRREPCVLVDLPPGSYTAMVKPFELRSANVLEDQPAVPGVGIIEVYEIGR